MQSVTVICNLTLENYRTELIFSRRMLFILRRLIYRYLEEASGRKRQRATKKSNFKVNANYKNNNIEKSVPPTYFTT